MSPSSDAHVSLLDSCDTELRILRVHGCNALIEGSADMTDRILDTLRPQVREPICTTGHGALDLPRRNTPTVILRDVSALTVREQMRLLTWLDGEGVRTQMLSTTADPLFRLVGRGLFDAPLYYRLNVLLVRVAAFRTDEASLGSDSRDRAARPDHTVQTVDP